MGKPPAKKPATKKPAKRKSAPRRSAMDKQFEAEDDLRTLRRAEEIKARPGRVTAARRIAKKEMEALKKV